MSEEPKKETVRITLPPRPANGVAGGIIKHETVRITTPTEAPIIAATVASSVSATAPTPLPPPPKPLGVGLPPKPIGAGLPPKPLGAPLPPRPVAPATFTPRPPGMMNAAAAPLAPKPLAPVSSHAAPAPAPKPLGDIAPVSRKPSPKKETARIQNPNSPRPLPQATLKLQQTQPVAQAPAAAVKSTGPISQLAVPPAKESLLIPILVFLVSLAAFGIQLWTFVY